MPSIEEDYEALIQFLYLAPVGLAQTGIDGEIAMINPISAQLLLPISRDGDLNNLFDVLDPVAPELRHLCTSFTATHGMICDALRIQLTAGVPGQSDPRVLSLSLLKLDQSRLMAVISDVTLQVKRERQLKQNDAWFNAILTGIADYALVSINKAGAIEDWNTSIGRLTGFTREALVGKPYSAFYPAGATTPESLLDRLAEADASGWSLADGEQLRADGTRYWASTMIAPLGVHDAQSDEAPPEERTYCLIIRDISERREAGEIHRRASTCDHLTGIANRRTFFDAAALEMERMKRLPRPLTLILFDADYFKKINDRYGHPAGDAVLRQLAASLTATFRQIDVVARVGGEEFAILLPSTDLEGARVVAERLRSLVESQVVEVDGVSIRYTISGGIATMHETVLGLDVLMKRADQALYAAKARGRNCIECWHPDPDAAAVAGKLPPQEKLGNG
jgi:diguanylate cyclase (GGDEF)-like protein/PAS domain S-box-containing protein